MKRILKMKRILNLRIKIREIIIGALIVVTAVSFTFGILLFSTPYKQSGSLPVLSYPVESSAEWDGNFANFLVCGIDGDEGSADTILLVSFNNTEHTINILQIPRETWADGTNTHLYGDYYSGHEEGISNMENIKAHIEQDYGIMINYYAAFTLTGMRRLVDAFGGVDLAVPEDMDYDDPAQGLSIHLKKGTQHLTGALAEDFVLYRGGENGDFRRLGDQRVFLAALVEKLLNMGAVSLSSKLVTAVRAPDFISDMNNFEIISFALAAKNVSLSDITVSTVPGCEVNIGGGIFFKTDKAALYKILSAHFIAGDSALSLNDMALSIPDGDMVSSEQAVTVTLQGVLNTKSP